MKSVLKIAALTALAFSVSTIAQALPGSKILTTGSGERTAMTAGMKYEDADGVHVFRGRAPAIDEAPAPQTTMRKEIDINITVTPVFRRIRHLRTQGFYSGVAYPSRRYTQGFYSGR